MNEKPLTASELARVLGTHRETVLRWAREGKIPCLRIGEKTVRFDVETVLQHVRADTPRSKGGAR